MTRLAFTRSGAGPALVLLHPLGTWRGVWDPVVPALAGRFDVIAVDLPGFGESEPLPAQVEPSPAALAAGVAGLLDELGVTAPHVAGNSLGGWVALELARLRPVASLTLLSPAGLWGRGAPVYARVSLRASRWLSQNAAPVLSRLVDHRFGRALVLGQTHGRPSRVLAADARAAVRALGTCPGFDATMRATSRRRFRAGMAIPGPVTVAFGTRDLLLPRWTRPRRLDQLPRSTRSVNLPGCGHLPMADDPKAVVAVIEETTGRAARPA